MNEQDWGNVENRWEKLKLSILKVARKVCGITRLNSSKKQTSWWNDQIKKQIRSKKERWKIYLGNKTDENYNKYKEGRKRVKEQVLAAKGEAWKDFGNKMEDISKGNQKLFYRILKNMRTEKAEKIINIKDKDGNIIEGEKSIMER